MTPVSPRHVPPYTPRKDAKRRGTAQLRDEPAAGPPTALRPAAGAAYGVDVARASVRPAGQRKTRLFPSSCAGREHERSNGSTTTCSHCYCALACTCSNLNRRQLRSDAASGRRSWSLRPAIAWRSFLASRKAVPRATPLHYDRHVGPCRSNALTTSVLLTVMARRRRRSRCARCDTDTSARQWKSENELHAQLQARSGGSCRQADCGGI